MIINNNTAYLPQDATTTNTGNQNSSISFEEQMKIEKSSVSETPDITETQQSEYTEEEIKEYLKDKPLTSLKYEFYQKYSDDNGKAFITDQINRFHGKYKSPPSFYEGLNDEAKLVAEGCNTVEKLKERLLREKNAVEAYIIESYAWRIPDVYTYEKDYGISVTHERFNKFTMPSEGIKSSLMYKDITVNEDGQVMILPKNSDEWVTEEEFSKDYPDYQLFKTISCGKNQFSISKENPEFFKKYIERFIDKLSDYDKKLIKDNDLLSSPALKAAGIKGIEQFTKELDDIKVGEVHRTVGLNSTRKKLIQMAEQARRQFIHEKAYGMNPSKFEILIDPCGYTEAAKLIRELGLNDVMRINASKIDFSEKTIGDYYLNIDFFNEYSDCFYIPERDDEFAQSEDFTEEEYQSLLKQYGSKKNIENALIYAINNNLSSDILNNDYSAFISDNKDFHLDNTVTKNYTDLKGRNDFLSTLFSEKNNNEVSKLDLNKELYLQKNYLSAINTDKNINSLLDII